MGEHQYVLSQTTDAPERERLALFERTLDPLSQRLLALLDIQPGWRCLEVGAGHGSVARWLAERVGPQGRVVATDLNPRFLTALQVPNVEVRQHDIRTDPLEREAYDLAHCRCVLAHLPDPQRVVGRMVEAVRIGGWLLIEEPDFSSLRAVEAAHPLAEVFNRQISEICERVVQGSTANLYFGRQVRGLLEEAGLTEIENEGVNRIVRGGEADARLEGMTLQAFMERGFLSQAEYAEVHAPLLDPSFSFIQVTMFAAWGKRTS